MLTAETLGQSEFFKEAAEDSRQESPFSISQMSQPKDYLSQDSPQDAIVSEQPNISTTRYDPQLDEEQIFDHEGNLLLPRDFFKQADGDDVENTEEDELSEQELTLLLNFDSAISPALEKILVKIADKNSKLDSAWIERILRNLFNFIDDFVYQLNPGNILEEPEDELDIKHFLEGIDQRIDSITRNTNSETLHKTLDQRKTQINLIVSAFEAGNMETINRLLGTEDLH